MYVCMHVYSKQCKDDRRHLETQKRKRVTKTARVREKIEGKRQYDGQRNAIGERERERQREEKSHDTHRARVNTHRAM
jgi:hypothetical protein